MKILRFLELLRNAAWYKITTSNSAKWKLILSCHRLHTTVNSYTNYTVSQKNVNLSIFVISLSDFIGFC